MLDAGLSANLKYQCAECISNTQTRCGICRSETAIWLAAHNGRGEILQLLLAHGANPRAEPKTGATALHRAAERGDEQMVLHLLRAGWDPNRVDTERRTPALYAAWKGHRGVFDMVLKNGAKIGDLEAGWISYWIHTKNSNALKLVLGPLEPASFSKQNIISPSPRRAASWPVLHPLREAIKTGDVAVTRCLLEYNKRHAVFADSDYLDGFRSATDSNNEALLELLVEYWPWTDKRTREQHVYAAVKHKAAHGHLSSVLMLIEWHYEFGRCLTLLATALFTAVYYAQMATVRGLIATAGADVNTRIPQSALEVLGQVRRGWDGDYPLHVAARHGNAQMCEILLEHGADLATRGYNDFTPLHLAAAQDYSSATEVLQLLLDHGADLEATTRYGKTPIHVARGVKNIVCLHEAGANLDHQDSYDKTALHRAASVGDMEKYECLVELGADESLRDRDGVSARECYEAKLEEMRKNKICSCSRSRMRTLCSCTR
ncbi:ankyrin repeat-containing domain protein [Aspergillus germanicus]